MSKALDARAREVFDQVLDRPAAERPQHLERACDGDAALRARVEVLLAAAEKDDEFLCGPTLSAQGKTPALNGEPTGTQIGPYTLQKLIGEGGFGSVYLAEQQAPIRRAVALKIIKAGMDTGQVIARFEAERQALALMDHPNIARVLEAGATEGGRPYFAMELVPGEPVTRFCDRQRLTLAQRLGLFRDVCAAVQHAHQKGIIHRDLKPSNVLVSDSDAGPVVKVIDFGIAKATAARPAGATLTESHQLIGTPEYMSPEQAGGDVDIDTRSDIYALGVLLYELLTGATPFDRARFRTASFAEIQRIIREEPAPRPSTRVDERRASSARLRLPTPVAPPGPSTDSALDEIAHRRRATPPALMRGLRGDLDWIVMKCLEKERDRRYQTAGALADDVARYLDHQVVRARPPSALYRLRKFVRRHRAGTVAAALVPLALAIGLGAALYGLRIAQQERDAARAARLGEERQRLSARLVADFSQQMLAGAGPAAARGLDPKLLHALLDQSFDRLEDAALRDTPEAEAELRITIANTYRAIGDLGAAGRALAPVESLLAQLLTERAALRERWLDARAALLSARAQFDESLPALNELLSLRRRMFGDRDHRVALTLAAIGADQLGQGRVAEAAATLQEGLEAAEASGDDATLANVLTNLAEPLGELGRHAEAAAAAGRALDHIRRVHAGDHPHVADVLNNYAAALRRLPGQADRSLELLRESIEMKRRLYPDGHPHLGVGLENLAYALEERGLTDEAERTYREALGLLRRFSPEADENVIQVLISLGTLVGQHGDRAQQEALAREALELCGRVYPRAHPNTASAQLNLGASLVESGQIEAGAAALEQAAELVREALGPLHPYRAAALQRAGAALIELGRFEQAVPLLRAAADIHRSAGASARPAYAGALARLAAALRGLGTPEAVREADELERESSDIRSAARGD